MDKTLNKVMSRILPLPPDNALIVFNQGNSCFIKDDGCYVLKNYIKEEWRSSYHLFPEAISKLKTLPTLK